MQLVKISQIITLIGLAFHLHADLIIKDGSIKNENTGPVKFDTNNDGTQDITFTLDGKVGVGVSSPAHTFDLKGSFGMIPQTVTSDTTLSGNSLILADTSGGSIELTLPLAATAVGRMYEIKKVSDSNSLTVRALDLLERSETVVLTTSSSGFAYINIFSDGGKWNVRSQSVENNYSGSGNFVGWWSMDETSGTVANDLGGQGLDGSLSGGLSFSSNTTTGKVGNALLFDGVDDLITVNHTASLDVPQFTICFWLKKTSEPNDYAGIINKFKGTVPKEGWTVLFGNADPRRAYFALLNDSNTEHNTYGLNTFLNVGVWRHFSYTFDGSNIVAYENGQSLGSVAFAGTINYSTNNLFMGGGPITLDDVRIYNLVLDADQIQVVYELGQ